jgi:hypothetical protein
VPAIDLLREAVREVAEHLRGAERARAGKGLGEADPG